MVMGTSLLDTKTKIAVTVRVQARFDARGCHQFVVWNKQKNPCEALVLHRKRPWCYVITNNTRWSFKNEPPSLCPRIARNLD